MRNLIRDYEVLASPGDLVGYLGHPALVVSHPVHESFIGAMIEIVSRGRKIKVSGFKKAIVTIKKGQNIDLTTGI